MVEPGRGVQSFGAGGGRIFHGGALGRSGVVLAKRFLSGPDSGVDSVTVFSPAKINLFLAITERRTDGFHNLVSVVAPVAFGDTLEARANPDGALRLTCDHAEVPTDASNLVLRAAERFRRETGWGQGVTFHLEKRIPVGAGLGGGSGNAVAAWRALQQLSGRVVAESTLETWAAELGSDCVLFLQARPLVTRGRGERVVPLPGSALARLQGQRLLLFKPSFGIATAWAYRQMAAEAPRHYLPANQAEAQLESWIRGNAPVADLLLNTMEGPAFAKYLALPTLLHRLRDRYGLPVRMSGSGSACFAVVPPEYDLTPVQAEIRAAWGDECFLVETKIP